MEHRRRRTDLLPQHAPLQRSPHERAQQIGDCLGEAGFERSAVLHVPDDGSEVTHCAGSGARPPAPELARGLARHVAREGRALRTLRDPVDGARYAAMPVGRLARGTLVLVVADQRMTRREAEAIAAWGAPREAVGMQVQGGKAGPHMYALARQFQADIAALALFAPSGVTVQLHVRSGALLLSSRLPADTIWGEVARHQASFTLGDLALHPGAEVLAALGMRFASLVGLENGHGIAVGAVGIASYDDLDLRVAHDLLALAPGLGPKLMHLLSSTRVPVPDEDGSVDLEVLAARVGCERFAMYERAGDSMRLVAAHTADGSRLMTPPDQLEQQVVGWAIEQRVGIVSHTAAAVLIGEDTVLYAQDPAKRALDCLRMALHDVQRNPFEADRSDAA